METPLSAEFARPELTGQFRATAKKWAQGRQWDDILAGTRLNEHEFSCKMLGFYPAAKVGAISTEIPTVRVYVVIVFHGQNNLAENSGSAKTLPVRTTSNTDSRTNPRGRESGRERNSATITLIGRDKTGVIARVTNCLFELGANIEALEEQVRRGEFSMVLQASWPRNGMDEQALENRLEKLGASLGMETRIRITQPNRSQRMAIMATREPHCPRAILDACRDGLLKAVSALVLSNRPDLEPLAREYGVPFVRIGWQDRHTGEAEALRVLDEHEVDFIALARFMKILSPNFVWRYPKKIINIHPSLLPSFPGAQAYRQAWERGVKVAGVTAHFVTMDLDEGPIISQDSFPIRPNMRLDDIVKKGQRLEASVLVRALRAYVAKRLDVSWGVVSGM